MPIVQRVNRERDYSDLDLDFIAHPTTGDVVRKKGEDAVKRSIRNLVLTNFYDRKFRHGIGSNATKVLFDNITPMTAMYLQNAIIEVITNYEPRARIASRDSVVVRPDIDGNGYTATIEFYLINRMEPVVFDLFLERIR
jgi:phage baseplate assembly protein W